MFSIFALLAARPLVAAPPDARLAIAAGKPHIERLDPSFTAAESDDESVLHAEVLPSGELLLEPKSSGVTLVFIFAPRLVRAVEVAVGVPLPAAEARPSGACAKTRITAACYPAWRVHLQHALAADEPAVDFELEGFQEEVKAAQAALGKGGMAHVALACSPFGVKLKGVKDAAEERRGLRLIWPWLLGPLRIDR